MNIRQVVETCDIGTILYSYGFGLNKMELIGKCTKDHSAYVYEKSVNRSSLLPDYYDGYFLTPQEAYDNAINNCNKQIEFMRREIERLERERKKY